MDKYLILNNESYKNSVELLSSYIKSEQVIKLVLEKPTLAYTKQLINKHINTVGLSEHLKNNMALAGFKYCYDEHIEYLASSYLDQIQYSFLDRTYKDLKYKVIAPKNIFSEQGVIFYSFHYGPYVLLFDYLSRNFNVGIMMGNPNEMIIPKLSKNSNIILTQEHPVSKSIDYINNNISVVILGDKSDFYDYSKNEKVMLLNKEFYVKRGVKHIYEQTKCKVYLVHIKYIVIFNEIEINFELLPSSDQILSNIYNKFNDILQKAPAQWERWKYYDRMSKNPDVL